MLGPIFDRRRSPRWNDDKVLLEDCRFRAKRSIVERSFLEPKPTQANNDISGMLPHGCRYTPTIP